MRSQFKTAHWLVKFATVILFKIAQSGAVGLHGDRAGH